MNGKMEGERSGDNVKKIEGIEIEDREIGKKKILRSEVMKKVDEDEMEGWKRKDKKEEDERKDREIENDEREK